MRNLLNFLYEERGGIVVLIGSLVALLIVVGQLARIFCWGKYRVMTMPSGNGTSYVIGEFFAKLINDFRHLLALVLVLIFAAVLLFGLCRESADFGEALQSVMATLGGLIGSIVGYYFGETAARRSSSSSPASVPIILPPDEGIQQAPPPPAQNG